MPLDLKMAAALFRLMRTGSCVFRTGACVLTQSARACSSSPAVQQDERVPHWAHTPLDHKIFKADTVEILFNSFEAKSLSIMQAANVISALAKLASQNPHITEDVLKGDKFQDVCNVIDANLHNMNYMTLLSTLKSLLTLGVPAEKFIIQTLETEVLWKLRKMSMRHMVFLLSFHIPFQQNDVQRKIIAEVLEKVQQRWFEISEPREILALLKLFSHFRPEFKDNLEDRTIELMNKMSVEDQHKIFAVLAEQKLRPIHLLRALAFHISKHQEKLTIKQMSNVFHAMGTLNFPDTVLLQRISNDLLPEVDNISKSSIMSSFLTAFGHLRWRHTALLEAFTEWFQKNLDQCRVQDMVAYVLTLANVNFVPMQSEALFPMLLPRLTLANVGSDVVWVDVVWALVVLQKAAPEHFTSVLTPEFSKKLQGLPENKSVPSMRKLHNIDAVAILELPKYKSLLSAKDSHENDLPLVLKGDQALRSSVINTLSNYIPKGKYLTCNKLVYANNYIDAEFIVDKECKPLSIEEHISATGSTKQLPPGAHRVALLVQDYKDFTLHTVKLSGQYSLILRVLQNMGYVVVQIPYMEYNCQEPTVKRLQYLQQKIQNAVNERNAQRSKIQKIN